MTTDMEDKKNTAAIDNSIGKEVEDETGWKWWYFVLAGIGIAGYSVFRTYDTGQLTHLGGLFLAMVCLLVGIGSRPEK